METDIDLAYIQRVDGQFRNNTAFAAWEGFKLLGTPIEFFENKQLHDGYLPIPLSKTTLVCGAIGIVKKALKEIGVPEPVVMDYPEELQEFLGRKVWTSTLGEIRRTEPKVFIKPKNEQKLFTGHVRDGHIGNLIQTAMCPDETEIYVSEPIKFVSEYRIFIKEGLMLGCQHYLGDFTIYPDFEVVTRALHAYTTAPAGYSMDFGVTDNGQTCLVEVNDGFALGHYGLPSMLYAQLMKERWLEMVNAEEK